MRWLLFSLLLGALASPAPTATPVPTTVGSGSSSGTSTTSSFDNAIILPILLIIIILSVGVGALIRYFITKKSDREFEEAHSDLDAPVATMEGRTFSGGRVILFVIFLIFTNVVGLLFIYWFPRLRAKLYTRAARLDEAEYALVLGRDGVWGLHTVTAVALQLVPEEYAEYNCEGNVRVLDFRGIRLLWSTKKEAFVEPSGHFIGRSFEELLEGVKGLKSKDSYTSFVQIFGLNQIIIPVPSIPVMLLTQFLHPFYMFQIFASILWWIEGYFIYPIFIEVVAVGGIVASVTFTRIHLLRLAKLARNESILEVQRFGKRRQESSLSLVPGDIVYVTRGMVLPCDMVLVSGEVVVDESALTGEANPVRKQKIEPTTESFNERTARKNTLFCGTSVLETRPAEEEENLGLVVRTGYNTTKGALFQAILFPKKMKFRFNTDSWIYLGFMAAIGIGCFILGYCVFTLPQFGFELPLGSVWVSALDLITQAVPPALPLVMTTGNFISLWRLNRKNIYCTAPIRMNLAGKVNVVCFDKTGTMTEDALECVTVNAAVNAKFVTDSPKKPAPESRCNEVMASAQSLVLIDGKVLGNSVDIAMFNKSGWHFENFNRVARKDRILNILHRFEFNPELQRMSAVCSDSNSSYDVFCKGSPEAVIKVCREDTVPADVDSRIKKAAADGLYVLAMSYRPLRENEIASVEMSSKQAKGKKGKKGKKKSSSSSEDNGEVEPLDRGEIESEMIFAGLLIFENKIKKETPLLLDELHGANIEPVMVTGDHLQAGMQVAIKSGLVKKGKTLFYGEIVNGSVEWVQFGSKKRITRPLPELTRDSDTTLGINGQLLDVLFNTQSNDTMQKIFKCTSVFGRVAPAQKSRVAAFYMDMGFYVAMVGDGVNDCGALRTAHAGIALSKAEASIVAPFTSQRKLIGDVAVMLREGRAALDTSMALFCYMVLYPVVQLQQSMYLNFAGTTLGDYQFLIGDLWCTTMISLLMAFTKPLKRLQKRQLPPSLFSPSIVLNVIGSIVWILGFFVAIQLINKNEPWYKPYTQFIPTDITSVFISSIPIVEVSTAFSFGTWGYIWSGIVTNITPFRRSMWTNKSLFIWFFVTWASAAAINLSHNPPTMWFVLREDTMTSPDIFPYEWRLQIFGWAQLQGVIMIGYSCLLYWIFARSSAVKIRQQERERAKGFQIEFKEIHVEGAHRSDDDSSAYSSTTQITRVSDSDSSEGPSRSNESSNRSSSGSSSSGSSS